MRSSLIFFECLDDADLAWIHQACTKIELAATKVLVQIGSVNTDVYILLAGKCKVDGADGRLLTPINAGDIIGEVSFVDKRKTLARVSAESNIVVARLDGDMLTAKLDSDPLFATRFYRGVASVLAFRLRSNLQLVRDKGSSMLSSKQEFAGEVDPVDLNASAKAGARLSYFLNRFI